METAVRLKEAKSMAIEAAKTALMQVQGGTAMKSIAEKQGLKIETLEFTANTRFLPNVGENAEFRKVGLHLNLNQRFGLSLNENRADLIHFKKRTLDAEEAAEQKDKVRTQLHQTLQEGTTQQRADSVCEIQLSIEVINPVFRTPDA